MLTSFNTFVGIGTIAILIITLSIWLLMFLQETTNPYFLFLKKHSFHFAFLLALGAIIGSLTYSELFGFAPCTFCWWQRIFMYPQLIVFATGIYLKDLKVWITGIALSVIGAIFSIYHILIQFGIIGPSGACATGGVSCAKIDVLIFNWITIPIMCLTLFIGILTFAYISHRKQA